MAGPPSTRRYPDRLSRHHDRVQSPLIEAVRLSDPTSARREPILGPLAMAAVKPSNVQSWATDRSGVLEPVDAAG
jgi:hypothetical protein